MNRAPDLRLDRTRPFSTVHGERNPGDPHYYVHFFQDSLPFGADEVLIPDDGKTEPWAEALEREDGTTKQVKHWPLYTAERRAKLDKKLKKLVTTKRAVQKPVAKPEDDDDEAPELVFASDEVNLISWLKGEIQYEPNEIFAACKQRFHVVFATKRAVVEDLVYDRKLVPEAEVDPMLLAMLDQPPAIAA